jgi:hypothetical protein
VGQTQLPVLHRLALGVGGRHAQHLDAAFESMLVPVGGFVEHMDAHANTSK